MAIIQSGFLRATEDIDLLIERSIENQKIAENALTILPDKVIKELQPGDLEKYQVVRVADEFVIDLMLEACGMNYYESIELIENVTIDGVIIPFASPELLLKLKNTLRQKDILDKLFLENLLKNKQTGE